MDFEYQLKLKMTINITTKELIDLGIFDDFCKKNGLDPYKTSYFHPLFEISEEDAIELGIITKT